MDYTPAFMELVMQWIRFAKKEPYLYKMLFAGNTNTAGDDMIKELDTIFTTMKKEIQKDLGLSWEEVQVLISQFMIQVNGIAAFIINGHGEDYTEEKINRCLSNTCLGMVLLFQTQDGGLTPEMAKRITTETVSRPVHT